MNIEITLLVKILEIGFLYYFLKLQSVILGLKKIQNKFLSKYITSQCSKR